MMTGIAFALALVACILVVVDAQCSGNQFENSFYNACYDCPPLSYSIVACGVDHSSSLICRYGYTTDEASRNYCNICDDGANFFDDFDPYSSATWPLTDVSGPCKPCDNPKRRGTLSCSGAGVICNPGITSSYITAPGINATSLPVLQGNYKTQVCNQGSSTPSSNSPIYSVFVDDSLLRPTPAAWSGGQALVNSTLVFRADRQSTLMQVGFMKRRCETLTTRQVVLNSIIDIPILGASRSNGTFLASMSVAYQEPMAHDTWIWLDVVPSQTLYQTVWYSITIPREECVYAFEPQSARMPAVGSPVSYRESFPAGVDSLIDVRVTTSSIRDNCPGASVLGYSINSNNIRNPNILPMSAYSIIRGAEFHVTKLVSVVNVFAFVAQQRLSCYFISTPTAVANGQAPLMTSCPSASSQFKNEWTSVWHSTPNTGFSLSAGVTYVVWYTISFDATNQIASDATGYMPVRAFDVPLPTLAWYGAKSSPAVHYRTQTNDTKPATNGTIIFDRSIYAADIGSRTPWYTTSKPISRYDELDYLLDVAVDTGNGTEGFYGPLGRIIHHTPPGIPKGDPLQIDVLGTLFRAVVPGNVTALGFYPSLCGPQLQNNQLTLVDANGRILTTVTPTLDYLTLRAAASYEGSGWIWTRLDLPVHLVSGVSYSIKSTREPCFLDHAMPTSAQRCSKGPLVFDSNLIYGSRIMDSSLDFMLDVLFVPDLNSQIQKPDSCPSTLKSIGALH